MQVKSIAALIILLTPLTVVPSQAQIVADEHEFQQLVAALRANDAERRSAITTCTKQGVGYNFSALAKLMEVPADRAVAAWCTRITNGIANNQLTLTDLKGLDDGTISPRAQKVLTTESEGQ
ncbi:hypothetical protein H0A58_02730 [Alcaligenaceae bacterium]|nr:hypothetical protein [Alcaligenaceae bacterium]